MQSFFEVASKETTKVLFPSSFLDSILPRLQLANIFVSVSDLVVRLGAAIFSKAESNPRKD